MTFCKEMEDSLCRRPMKLWEFLSAFRGSKTSISALVHDEKWATPYGEYLDRFDEMVRSQDRSILDTDIPYELSHAAAVLCEDLIFHISASGNVRLKDPNSESEDGISAVYLHDHFGGAILEEVLEKGSYRIPPDLLEKNKQNKAEMATPRKPSD
jgi:hypothetical protein